MLTGYTYKQQQLAAADVLANTAQADERTQRDRAWELACAQENAGWAAIGAGEGGAQACRDAAAVAAAEAVALNQQAAAVGGKGARPLKGQAKKAQAKADYLNGQAAKTNEERAQDILNAQADVAAKQLAAHTAAAQAVLSRQQATAAQQAAQAIPDLNEAWAKDHSAAGRSMRSLEADLRAMQTDLNRLNAAAPPGSVAYCAQLETRLDHDAHHVDCPRCNAQHGLDRTGPAKAAVMAQLRELERLGALPNDDGLTAQQVRDRSIAIDLNGLRAGGGGKMIGVLICTDGTELRAFSGDSAGRDDVEGWCQHIPPAAEGGSFRTANGRIVPLAGLPNIGTPHGVCAAPKLIQRAYALGKTPSAIAEVWYGGGNVQPHGSLVASCSTCRANLDIQLCNNYP